MITNYLSWYKDLEVKLQGRADTHLFLSSAVYEPTDILAKHLHWFHETELITNLDVSNAWGHPALIESIAVRYGIDAQKVLTTNGVSNAIYLLCRALLSANAHVVVESPTYEPLLSGADIVGSKIACLKRRPPNYPIDLDDLKRAVRSDTTLLFISNLHNPSGELLRDDSLRELAREAQLISPNIKIVVDEVYHDFVFGSQMPAATLNDCFISLNSLTKVYGLGCVHCGWILAAPTIIDKVRCLQLLVEGSGAKLLEGIASFIIRHSDEYLDRSARLVSHNRQLLFQYLKPLIHDGVLSGGVPEYGCMYFPRINGVKDIQKFTRRLAEKYRVYMTPGYFFGEPGHLRIGFGSESEQLRKGLERFTEAVYALVE